MSHGALLCAGEYVSANSALEEVYGILRHSYSDVIEDAKRNDSEHDTKNYDDDHDHYDVEEEVWRILDVDRIRHSLSPSKKPHMSRRQTKLAVKSSVLVFLSS